MEFKFNTKSMRAPHKLIYAMNIELKYGTIYLSRVLLSKAVCLSDSYLSTQFLRIFIKCVASKFAIELRISPEKLNKQWALKTRRTIIEWLRHGITRSTVEQKTRIRRCVHSTTTATTKNGEEENNAQHSVDLDLSVYIHYMYVFVRAPPHCQVGRGIWSISRTRVNDFHFPIPHTYIDIVWENNNNKYAENVVTKIYFSLFIFFSPEKRKEQQCFGPFQLRFSITHCSNFPFTRCKTRIGSVYRTLTALHYFLLKNKFAQKKPYATHTVCTLQQSMNGAYIFTHRIVPFLLRRLLLLLSSNRFFSHTLTIQSEGERERASSISISDEL